MSLSIVIACRNDQPELLATIASALMSAPPDVEFVVVDDASHRPIIAPVLVAPASVKLIRNAFRCGVGPSRHIGILNASHEMILAIDSHMRFVKGWYEAFLAASAPRVLLCAQCLGLDRDCMDPLAPKGSYYGATLSILGRDTKNRPEVLEPKWMRTQQANNSDIAVCLGAAYFFTRNFYLELNPLHHLRSWGEDEIMLSVKTWLEGGEARLCSDAKIGHKFRTKNDPVPFKIPDSHRVYNKLFAMYTLIPEKYHSKILNALRRFPGFREGLKMIENDWHLVASEQAYNRTIFMRDFEWYCQKFGISLP